MRLACFALAFCLCGGFASAQTVLTTFAWDYHDSHVNATFEIETTSGVVQCGSVIFGADIRCTTNINRLTSQNVRLRAVQPFCDTDGDGPLPPQEPCYGEWSAPITVPQGTAPGVITITTAFVNMEPVAHDRTDATGVLSNNPSVLFTPNNTPAAIIVRVMSASAIDVITGVTYGGVPMQRHVASKTSGEPGFVYAFFLGAGIPVGQRSVAFSTAAASVFVATITSLTAGGETEVIDTKVLTGDAIADPTVGMSLAGRTSFIGLTGISGHNVVGSTTPLTGWIQHLEISSGSAVGLSVSYPLIGSESIPAGWTQAPEDVVLLAVAVSRRQ